MRIAVVRTAIPLVQGGAERLSANLCAALKRHGHEVAEIGIPFKWYPTGSLVDHVLAAKLLDLTQFEGAPIDTMIGLKFPAWLARHPNKVFWILHQHRQAYDMWDSGLSDLRTQPDGVAVREMIFAEDRALLGRDHAPVYTIARNVSDRLRRYLNIGSIPLYHPPPNAELLEPGASGDYLFVPGRINSSKRQSLVLEALALAKAPIRTIFAGPPDSAAYLAELMAKARSLGVEGHVEWLGAIDDQQMVEGYRNARAVVFTPIDEDYGYVTLEAMLAGKPLIVTTDSGGPLEFVRDRVEGWITAPTAAALAAAFSEAMDDRQACERMGAAGLARYRSMSISWDTVVERLTGPHPTEKPVESRMRDYRQELGRAISQG
jgi:glycosyltransferase involved in cell wall biosynthesis